ncbi:2-keto-3-deoxy-galactonokinase [Vibrio nigripulchritudo ATCC 27043]|uniref:2-dehydro-3-deoxygalactonokinase n=1 Tax=Vibrio nigripulchritudo TaxID=28173 RepID=UPI00021C37C6|nr:2-dehydro-3-deoxygalactonokinase [Vibrio nigripulchritudo]EGU60201.1 2-keto-3-deoxy-galactonokinase [Vibrio nigripulchritudo ATCC 27043]
MTKETASVIAMDWGSTMLRAYLLSEQGNVMAEKSFPWGVLQRPKNEGRTLSFEQVFYAAVDDWIMAYPALHVYLTGMVTSKIGWVEVPYVDAPCGIEDIHAGGHSLLTKDCQLVHLIPGVCFHGRQIDLMRGEETQLLPFLNSWERTYDGWVILPGTHSKWVLIQNLQISEFQTYMTGELYSLLKKHSILNAGGADIQNDMDIDTFLQGVDAALNGSGIMSELFSCRSAVLFGEVKGELRFSYLSGLLIGSEVKEAKQALGGLPTEISLIGEESLCDLYRIALRYFKPEALVTQYNNTAAQGIWEMHSWIQANK